MPWCPRCKAEFREGFTECNHCHVPLVAKQPEQARAMDPVCIYTVNTSPEAENIVSLLHDNGIDVLVRDLEAGGWMKIVWGFSRFGSELFVDKAEAKRAQELVDVYLRTSPVKDWVNDPLTRDNPRRDRMLLILRIIIFFFLAASLILLIVNFGTNISSI